MKKLILMLTMVVLATTGFAQEDADKFQTPVFGQKVRDYYSVDVEGSRRDTTYTNTFLMSKEYRYNGSLVLYYDTYRFKSDSTLVEVNRRERATMPLQVSVTASGQTKTVKEWVQSTYTAQDSAKWVFLAKRLAIYKKVGEPIGE